MKKNIKGILGIILIAAGTAGSFIKVDTPWHYFGTTVVAIVGIVLLVSFIRSKKRTA